MKRWTANTLPAQSAVAWTGMLVVGLCLGGCLVGPDHEKPTVDMSASWMESSPEISVEPPEVREWWTVFGDPVLTALVNKAYEQNLTLRAAGLRVIQAGAARRGIAVGEFFPQEQSIRANYTLNVPANVPAKRFWSVLVYDLATTGFVENTPKAGVTSLDKGLKANSDGSTDIYFGPKAPKGKEANWAPTVNGHDYFLLFRVYGPEQPLFERAGRCRTSRR